MILPKNRFDAMNKLAYEETPYKQGASYSEDISGRKETARKGFAEMKRGLAARAGESLRQGDVLQQRAAYQAGGLGGAGLKMAQKNEAEIQRGIAGEEANIGAQEQQAYQALEEGKVGREFQAGEAARQREFAGDEATRNRLWEQKQRDTENGINMVIGDWNMTQTEMNDRFNRFVASKKAGFKKEEDWAKVYPGMVSFESGYGRTLPENMTGHWEKQYNGGYKWIEGAQG